MLWACLLLPSLPLDVFARSLSTPDAARPFAVTTGGHYPRIVAPNAAALLFARAECNVTTVRLPLLDDALAPLPLAHLDIAPDILAMLAAAGVTTFGQACALPRAGLARRVGAGFVTLLDRARGLVPDP